MPSEKRKAKLRRSLCESVENTLSKCPKLEKWETGWWVSEVSEKGRPKESGRGYRRVTQERLVGDRGAGV